MNKFFIHILMMIQKIKTKVMCECDSSLSGHIRDICFCELSMIDSHSLYIPSISSGPTSSDQGIYNSGCANQHFVIVDMKALAFSDNVSLFRYKP